ncbi:MAG: hypothetical protein KKA79_04490 [Nanoarchaeota archaeon]|nr:hypothetical protein [Nanoarchaeota archaeon]
MEILRNSVGKKVCLIHDEKDRSHSVIGIIESVDAEAIVLRTDFDVKNVIPLRCILKLKEIRDEGVSR